MIANYWELDVSGRLQDSGATFVDTFTCAHLLLTDYFEQGLRNSYTFVSNLGLLL